mmetsp:Transcript_30140/g.68048  ORF Transcript_30140/g.68048 Transcript_30140/m.68048 type:complete len:228 (+) Transcript_30140:1304-1987(+)
MVPAGFAVVPHLVLERIVKGEAAPLFKAVPTRPANSHKCVLIRHAHTKVQQQPAIVWSSVRLYHTATAEQAEPGAEHAPPFGRQPQRSARGTQACRTGDAMGVDIAHTPARIGEVQALVLRCAPASRPLQKPQLLRDRAVGMPECGAQAWRGCLVVPHRPCLKSRREAHGALLKGRPHAGCDRTRSGGARLRWPSIPLQETHKLLRAGGGQRVHRHSRLGHANELRG